MPECGISGGTAVFERAFIGCIGSVPKAITPTSAKPESIARGANKSFFMLVIISTNHQVSIRGMVLTRRSNFREGELVAVVRIRAGAERTNCQQRRLTYLRASIGCANA